ncbi:MerR family transcriptional regulator [Candidatus Avelusimicrobium gallicola]|uniref:MerR family transcriptional regulator n=1 Tax=Candidatus Avelusimicrobium gallicola TaxID=2562704 RepID=A0A1Y4DGU5_9BACT|nr:MerR family transcriptional regulator [Elusimicrobium sp. An273]OUO56148.1 MerR family transcriptional regulator [Elusimicrobium sp. An273]
MTISEVSKKYGLSVDTLRYYEKAGLIPPVNRKENGIRDYTETDCGWVEFVKCMREAGLPIEVLTQYIALYAKGNRTLQQRKNLLVTERDRLKERIEQMQQTLKRLNYKISVYEQRIVACEKKLLK